MVVNITLPSLCVVAQVDLAVLEQVPHYWFLHVGILAEGVLLFASIAMKISSARQKQQKDQHLAATSHDIHHHLYLMRLTLASLSDGPPANSTANQSVETLKQSMENLINNALEYTRKGGARCFLLKSLKASKPDYAGLGPTNH